MEGTGRRVEGRLTSLLFNIIYIFNIYYIKRIAKRINIFWLAVAKLGLEKRRRPPRLPPLLKILAVVKHQPLASRLPFSRSPLLFFKS